MVRNITTPCPNKGKKETLRIRFHCSSVNVKAEQILCVDTTDE